MSADAAKTPDPPQGTRPASVVRGADLILAAYVRYLERLGGILDRARTHFERRDWRAVQEDSVRRLDVYDESVHEGLAGLRDLLGVAVAEHGTWSALRDDFARLVAGRGDAEIAGTFFNSFTRRLFHTVGVDPGMEFVSPVRAEGPDGPSAALTVTFPARDGLAGLFDDVLEHFRFDIGYEDARDDARRIADAVAGQCPGLDVRSAEFARAMFFRGKGCYLVGRLNGASGWAPCLIALVNVTGRVGVDAVLTTADEVSIVFSFARSYFFVRIERPSEMVAFLRSIMPRKQVAELYTALGFNKHGKTELYRNLLDHLRAGSDRFEIAPGQRGMVMAVFTLPGFDVVFKVLRDRFEAPKTVTADEVRAKYRLVFRHDRAGRLVDAQEFEHLAFDCDRFDAPLLDELARSCSERVRVEGERVVISHLYTERRLNPLDMYLRTADGDAARDAVIDYGQVLRDLAATNIFPGDMLTKNFGVSRHGRLMFYDYDELATLTDCRFRELPAATHEHDEGAAEPWFYVGERDIFPEEFRAFLGLQGELLSVFLAHHEELLRVTFWHRMQELHRRGEVLDIYPYRSTRRLRRSPRAPGRA